MGAQVAAHAQCPVAVIRAVPAPTAHEVVVGIDGSTAAEAALAFAFDAASRNGWKLVAVHAWDVPAYDLLIVPNGPVPIPLADVADDEVRLTAEVLAEHWGEVLGSEEAYRVEPTGGSTAVRSMFRGYAG